VRYSVKILFVGDLNPNGRTYQRKRAIEELGHSVSAHSSVPEVWARAIDPKPSLLSRVLWKTGLPLDPTRTNRTILLEVEKQPPSLFWIEKGNTVWPQTLRAVKELSPVTQIISYTEDDMFAPHNRSLFYRWGLKYYDVVFTTKSYNCSADELPSLGAKRVIFVDKAYDIYAHRPVPVTSDDIEAFGGNVGFIGTYERERAESMLYLAKHGVSVRVWGYGWRKLVGHHPNLIIENRPIFGEDYAKGLCATRINLCFLRKINRDLQTDRSIEIPACGAFMLAERTDEHLRLFEEGKEAAYFSSNEELLEKVRYYLGHEEERRTIAAAGRQRCLDSGYSHHERLKYMLSVAVGKEQ
jgi:spore maturation protein CgeB